MRRLQFGFYNLAPAGDPQRGPAFVARESEAIVNNRPRNGLRRHPKVYGVVEAIGRRLPELEHYTMIRDTSTPSRANIALYVRKGLKVGTVRWIDHQREWKRPLHPGMHEPRSTLVVTVEDWTVVVAHAPQVGAPMAAARDEWLAIEAHLLAAANRNWPVLLLSDSNALWDELLKRNAGTAMGGTPIESAHTRFAVLRRVRVRPSVGGVPMLSDHKRCLLGTAVRR
jgi:hypothetical protein